MPKITHYLVFTKSATNRSNKNLCGSDLQNHATMFYWEVTCKRCKELLGDPIEETAGYSAREENTD